jgi:hypothetical protein
MRDALSDRDPDGVGREHEWAVLAIGDVHGMEERLTSHAANYIAVVVEAALDRTPQHAPELEMDLIIGERLVRRLHVVDGERYARSA